MHFRISIDSGATGSTSKKGYCMYFMYWMSFDTLHSILGYNKVLRGYVLSDIDRVKTIIEVHFQMGLDLGI